MHWTNIPIKSMPTGSRTVVLSFLTQESRQHCCMLFQQHGHLGLVDGCHLWVTGVPVVGFQSTGQMCFETTALFWGIWCARQTTDEQMVICHVLCISSNSIVLAPVNGCCLTVAFALCVWFPFPSTISGLSISLMLHKMPTDFWFQASWNVSSWQASTNCLQFHWTALTCFLATRTKLNALLHGKKLLCQRFLCKSWHQSMVVDPASAATWEVSYVLSNKFHK